MFKKLALLVILSSAVSSSYAQFSNIEIVPTEGNRFSEYTKAWASTGDRWGKVGTPIKLQSNHTASATNPTDRRIDVRFTYKLCADDQGCHYESIVRRVEPHQTIHGGQEKHLQTTYYRYGNYRLCAETIIEGNEAGNDFANECHTIYVSK